MAPSGLPMPGVTSAPPLLCIEKYPNMFVFSKATSAHEMTSEASAAILVELFSINVSQPLGRDLKVGCCDGVATLWAFFLPLFIYLFLKGILNDTSFYLKIKHWTFIFQHKRWVLSLHLWRTTVSR